MSLQEYEKCILSIYFTLFVANISIKIISSRKKCDFFSSASKKIIPNNTTPTFQEVDGVTQPLIFLSIA